MKIIKENPTKWKLKLDEHTFEFQDYVRGRKFIRNGVPRYYVDDGEDCVHNFIFEGIIAPTRYSADGQTFTELDSLIEFRMRHAMVFKLLESLKDGTVKYDKKRRGFKGLFTFTNQSGAISLTVHSEKAKKATVRKKDRAKNSNR